MRLTLLQYVQSILSSLSSDEVNSISDTVESLQVAEIVRSTYFNIITRAGLIEHKQLVQLEPSINPDMPTMMFIPDGIGKLEWVKYFDNNTLPNISGNPDFQHDLNVDITSTSSTGSIPPPGYKYVIMLPVTHFLDMTSSFNPENSNVESFTFTDNSNNYPGTYTFYYKNDKTPQYCTVLSNYYVIFDGYDAAVDDTLQASKTQAYGTIIPYWKMEDSFIPNMDEEQVPLLLNEAKSLAFYELKQTLHQKAEQESKRQWGTLQKDKSKSDQPSYFAQLPNFGRWARSNYSGMSYFKLRGWDRS